MKKADDILYFHHESHQNARRTKRTLSFELPRMRLEKIVISAHAGQLCPTLYVYRIGIKIVDFRPFERKNKRRMRCDHKLAAKKNAQNP